MLELPEAHVIARQLNETIRGKTVDRVAAAQSPHKFAWYTGDPQGYDGLLADRQVGDAAGVGGMVRLEVGPHFLVFSDGANLRFHGERDKQPQKHQLLLSFDDGTALSASVQMYGGLMLMADGQTDNSYYLRALEAPSPLTDAFSQDVFSALLEAPGAEKLSAKALLATEQRIPGLGNGVLQDILFRAGIHPKRRLAVVRESERDVLYLAIRRTLSEMTAQGGRDTEKDLFGCSGGYVTKLSRNSADKPCVICGKEIRKAAYLGGSIYWCTGCQPEGWS